MKKLIILVVTLVMTFTTNAQLSYFSQDPCMAALMTNGCKEVFETKEFTDATLSMLCPGMKVRITLSKLICNGNVVSIHIWSAGANSGPGNCAGGTGTWSTLQAQMDIAIDKAAKSLIVSLGLNSVLVSTGSVCKAKVTFDMPAFTSTTSTETQNPIPGGPSIISTSTTTNPGGKYSFTLPCASDACCYGYADIVNNEIVNVTPAPSTLSNGCPTPLTAANVKDWIKQTFQVTGGGENLMFNIVIGPCEEDCDLSKLIGEGEYVWKSTKKPAAGQTVNYNISIESIKAGDLIFKSDVLPSYFEILDINGRVVDKKLIQSNIIDIKTLSKGIFFLKANYDNGLSSVVKFVKD
jgi:hypothetical protein